MPTDALLSAVPVRSSPDGTGLIPVEAAGLKSVTEATLAGKTPFLSTGGIGPRHAADRAAGMWVDIKDKGAVGNGIADDTYAVQKALDDVATGGTVIVPQGMFKMTASATCTGKDVTIIFVGKLLDRIPSWTANYADLTLNGKGLLAFDACRLSLRGSGGIHIDGGSTTGGVSATNRNLIYAYNCTMVNLQGVNTENFNGSAVATFKCSNITHLDSQYFNGGSFAVLHSRCSNTRISNVTVRKCQYNGITIIDRGGFVSGVLPDQRCTDASIDGCIVTGLTSPSTYAVGITIDSADRFSCTDSFVDGGNTATMAYSFAGSAYGTVSGNRAKDYANVSNGSYTYTGIGMELDSVHDVACVGNTFTEVLIPHIILNSYNLTIDGLATCNAAKSGVVSTGAATSAFVAMQNGSTTLMDRIRISGVCDGCSLFVNVQGNTGRLSITNAISHDFGTYFMSVSAPLSSVSIDQLKISLSGPAKQAFSASDEMLSQVVLSNITATAASAPGTAQEFFRGEAPHLAFTASGLSITNWDIGLHPNLYNRFDRVTIRDCHFKNVVTPVAGYDNLLPMSVEGCTQDGVILRPFGHEAQARYGSGAPSDGATFVGQRYIDTVTRVPYTAVATGTGAGDWVAAASPAINNNFSDKQTVSANVELLLQIIRSGTPTGAAFASMINSGGNYFVGVDDSVGARLFGVPYSLCLGSESSRSVVLATNNTKRVEVDGAGVTRVSGPVPTASPSNTVAIGGGVVLLSGNASDPVGVPGMLYYDGTNDRLRAFIGGVWKTITVTA